MKADYSQFSVFTAGYIACALWCGVEFPENHPDVDRDKDYSASLSDIEEDTLKNMISDCYDFETKNQTELNKAFDQISYSEEMAGHDFWLTRNGHGAGFWDRNELPKELRDKLTSNSKEYGEVNLLRTDSGTVSQI